VYTYWNENNVVIAVSIPPKRSVGMTDGVEVVVLLVSLLSDMAAT
jgi:hypothetical protein